MTFWLKNIIHREKLDYTIFIVLSDSDLEWVETVCQYTEVSIMPLKFYRALDRKGTWVQNLTCCRYQAKIFCMFI